MAQEITITVRWERSELAALDAWCDKQTVKPKRVAAIREAVRRLIAAEQKGKRA